ncbi:MAG: helix-turn-helix domain-containing protein [Desulfovibrionaceae bacterium]
MSELLDIARGMARDLADVGAMDEITMRQIEALALPPKREFSAEEVRSIRRRSKVSQAVFAEVLGINKTTVQHWEQGRKKPSGSSRRLLDIIERKGLQAAL